MIKRAVAGCDAVLVVLVPHGVHGYSTGTAQAVLDYAEPGARLVHVGESPFLVYIDSGRPVYVQRNGLAVRLK